MVKTLHPVTYAKLEASGLWNTLSCQSLECVQAVHGVSQLGICLAYTCPDTLETEYLEGAGLSNAHKESNLPNTAVF